MRAQLLVCSGVLQEGVQRTADGAGHRAHEGPRSNLVEFVGERGAQVPGDVVSTGAEQVSLDVIRQHSSEAAAAFDWANKEHYSTDLTALRRIHPALMDLRAWLTGAGTAKVDAALAAHHPEGPAQPTPAD